MAEPIPELLASQRVFAGKLINVRVDELREPDGRTYTREIVEYGQAVVLAPVDAEGRLLMVRQYRHAVGDWLLELPAGGIDDHDSSPEEAAMRELREETGHRGTLTRIGGMYLAPGYSEEYQHVYAATNLILDPLDPDADETLLLERVPVDDALSLIDKGVVRDAKSIAAMLMFLRHRDR